MPATSDARKRGGLHRRRIIERPRLLALLNGSPARVRTLIAPAGYGKTTLAEQWVGQEGRRHAWFTARPASTDVAALALGLARAATAIVADCDVRLREHLRALPAPAEHVDVLAELLGEDLASWPEDAWLVVDDYHELASNGEAERLIEELVAASSTQLLITSRQRPSWITARKILYGEVLELNQTELAMDGHEAAEVLIESDAASASGLVALANGWPAVIGLAGISGAQIEQPDAVSEALYQFFAEEVFSSLPQDVQAGLTTLAIAPIMDRALALRLLGGTCDRICAAALDVGILVERGAQLEIHPLARAFLEARLEHSSVDGEDASIEGCLEHFRERKDWDAAFDVATRRQSARRVESLLTEALDDLLDSARLSTVETWCEFAEQHGSHGSLFSLARAEVALRRGRLVAAQSYAASVASESSELQYRALAVAGQAAHLASREEEALELYRRAESVAPTDAAQRECLWNQARCMAELEMPEAMAILEQLTKDASHDDASDVVRSVGCRLYFQTRFGQLDLSEADRVQELLGVVSDPIIVTGFQSIYSSALASSARYADAQRTAQAFLATVRRYRLDFALPWALCACGLAEIGFRNWKEAEARIGEGLVEARRTANLPAEDACVTSLTRALCQQGRYEDALAITPPQRTDPMNASRAIVVTTRALALAACGRLDDAQSTIDSVRGHSRAGENSVLIAAVEAAVALRGHSRDVIDRAQRLSELAFATGELDLLVTAYRSVPELLAVLLRADRVGHDRISDLVRRAGDEDLASALGHPLSSSAQREGLLTNREREVYELLRQGLTNREIAQLLVISERTAKLHVHHVFGKLGVRSRKTIAIQAALERSGQATSAIADTGAETGS